MLDHIPVNPHNSGVARLALNMANQQGRLDSTMANRRLGMWLIGAFGSVGSSVALGLAALQQQLIEPTGLVTSLSLFDHLRLVPFDEIEIGGHDIIEGDFRMSAAHVGGMRPAYAHQIIEKCGTQLENWTMQVRPAMTWQQGQLDNDWKRFSDDLLSFRKHHQLDHTVVVNLAPTEPEHDANAAHADLSLLVHKLKAGDAFALPPSSWYAYAAIESGCSYVNFTPSRGASLPALEELARVKKVALAGQDGKTGETLLKTVLAPMFARRNFNVLSWIGQNILGNNDGRVLSDPANRAAKIKNKDRVIADILGYHPQTLTSIDFVESLDDWKTAWDHVHFQGFLNVPMTLQFTWQGCDSALAAPLVIDLVRLTGFARAHGESGVLPHLAMFFKAPLGCSEHDFSKQWNMLEHYVASHT